MSDLYKLRTEREREQIALGKSVIIIICSVFLIAGGIAIVTSYIIRLSQRADTERKYECAQLCIPHDVVVCPDDDRPPICVTNEPWPASYVAGTKPTDKSWDGSKYPERK